MIGIWHDNQYNAFNLVDDLIEPLRPMVDILIIQISKKYTSLDPLTSDIKKELCALLSSHLIWEGKEYDLFVVLIYYCASFREALSGTTKLQIPVLIFD
jgi:CRISPR-associated protein Cas1